MYSESILERLRAILAKELELEIDKIQRESRITDDLGADSLDIAEISMVIKEEFGHDLTEDEMLRSKKVEDLVSILEKSKTQK